MRLPPIDSLEGLSLADLRGLVGALISEVRGLQDRVESLEIENQALRAENQSLKDEIARLKNLPPRPPVKPAKSSGKEKATQPKSGKGNRRRRGAKHDGGRVSREVTVAVNAPAGSRFKGYETILVRDLVLSAEVVRYRRECWVTPGGERIVAPLPAGIVGGWGANLRRFILACHIQGQVTTERLTALLTGIGVDISKRQVVRLISQGLEAFAKEDRDVLRAGLATASWITVDDTSARHAHRNGYTTQIGDGRFTAFRTGQMYVDASQEQRLQAETWWAGYLTAMNRVTGDTYDLLGERDFADANAWLETWCSSNPDALHINAVHQRLESFYPDRTRSAP